MTNIDIIMTESMMLVGDVEDGVEVVKINYPCLVAAQRISQTEIKMSVSTFPPGINKLVDDVSKHYVVLQKKSIIFRGRASDALIDQWRTASNQFRNIAIPTTGQIIDIEK